MGTDRRHNVHELREQEIEAEKALLQWASDTLHQRQPAHAHLIDYTFDIAKTLLGHRLRLLDMAARLAPEE